MTKTLEEDGDVIVSPDDWAELVAKPAPLDVSAELQRQVDEFLAHGGRIQEFEPGETAIEPSRPLWSFPVGKAATPDPIKRIQAEARRKGAAAVRKDKRSDEDLIKEIDPLLDTAETIKGLHTAVNCSGNLLQRLLQTYFPSDPRADKFRAKNRIDHAMEQVAQIRALVKQGNTGIATIARLMNTDRARVIKLDRDYGLRIPRDDGGTAARALALANPKEAIKRKYTGSVICSNAGCAARLSGIAQYCPHCGEITARGLKKGAEE